MKDEPIKPCPFCSGASEIRKTGRNQLTIGCTKCHTKRVGKFLRLSESELSGLLVAAWNTRTETAHMEDSIKAMRHIMTHAATCLKFMSDDFAIGCRPDDATATGTLSDQLKECLEQVGERPK